MTKVFKNVRTDDDFEYWATNDLTMNDLMRLKYAEMSWMTKIYHRGIKQFCGIERCLRVQKEHSAITFLRLEYQMV